MKKEMVFKPRSFEEVEARNNRELFNIAAWGTRFVALSVLIGSLTLMKVSKEIQKELRKENIENTDQGGRSIN